MSCGGLWRVVVSRGELWYARINRGRPVALVVIFGVATTRFLWKLRCPDKPCDGLSSLLDDYVSEKPRLEGPFQTSQWSMLPIWTAVCAFVRLVFSMITPVPELYQTNYCDEQTYNNNMVEEIPICGYASLSLDAVDDMTISLADSCITFDLEGKR